MLWFQNDYSVGAHPQVLQHLIDTNMEKLSGYSTDTYCAAASEKIRAACECPDAEVFYISVIFVHLLYSSLAECE